MKMQIVHSLPFVNIAHGIEFLWLLMSVASAQGGTNTESCKYMLQGYLTGRRLL